jgi:phosphatidylinositol-3-phosphatase
LKAIFTSLFLCLILVGCGGIPKQAARLPGVIPTAVPGATSSASTSQAPHVILIIEENRSFSTVYPTGMPWLSGLGNANGIATNFYSDEPGSLLDYLWLSSGSGEPAFGCDGNACAQIITSDNIFRELNNAGLSWKLYAESLPSAGFMGTSSGAYVKRHNPAAWYSDVVNNPAQQQKIVPFTQFSGDLAANRLPSYSIIVPDLQHDAHDGTPAMADQWLQQNVAQVLSSSYFKPGGNAVMFITFDNGDGDAQGQVFTTVIGSSVIPGIKVSAPFRHENTLRTMMGLLGLKNFPGASAGAAPMSEFFK